MRTIESAISRSFRRLRLSRGLSQAHMAELLGVTAAQIQKYEAGVNKLPASTIYCAALALDVDVAAFFASIELDKAAVMQRLVVARKAATTGA